jgi:hypothetical protein
MSDAGPLAPRRRDPDNPLAIVPPRFSVDPKANMKGVRQDLVESVRAGAEWLPPGYRVVVTSAARVPDPNTQTPNSRHYRGGALDVEIIDPDGNRLPDRGPFGGGQMYKRLAHGVYNETLRRNPDLAAQMQWGGEFETVRGSGVSDYMHFDYGGRRANPARRQEGWAMPAAPGVGPTTQLAAAQTMTSPLDVGDRSTWPQTWNIPPELQGGVAVRPLGQTAAAPAVAAPPLQRAAYAQPEDEVFASGLSVPQAKPIPKERPETPPYTQIAETPSAAAESDAPVSGDSSESLRTGLQQPQREISLAEPFEARQPATSLQPFPDIAPNLYSGGAVPGQMAQAQQETNTNVGGGPLGPSPQDTVGAGGPSGAGDDKWKRPEESNSAMMLALMGAMMKGMKVTPINWDPFQKILAAGQASTEMPRSALATSPLGKMVSQGASPISTRTGPIVPRPIDVAAGTAPRNIYERMNLGLNQRRAGPETAA